MEEEDGLIADLGIEIADVSSAAISDNGVKAKSLIMCTHSVVLAYSEQAAANRSRSDLPGHAAAAAGDSEDMYFVCLIRVCGRKHGPYQLHQRASQLHVFQLSASTGAAHTTIGAGAGARGLCFRWRHALS